MRRQKLKHAQSWNLMNQQTVLLFFLSCQCCSPPNGSHLGQPTSLNTGKVHGRKCQIYHKNVSVTETFYSSNFVKYIRWNVQCNPKFVKFVLRLRWVGKNVWDVNTHANIIWSLIGTKNIYVIQQICRASR